MSKIKRRNIRGIWGSIIIKDGRIINRDELFQDMERSVGWTDMIRYPDCDTFNYLNEDEDYIVRKASACDNCRRAQYENDNDMAIRDCRGNSLHGNSIGMELDGNFHSYIGDEEFTICIAKDFFIMVSNREKVDKIIVRKVWEDEIPFADIYPFFNREDGKKVCRFFVNTPSGEVSMVVRHFDNRINTLEFRYKDSNYDIIFGNGVTSYRHLDKCFYKFHTKTVSNKINAYLRAHVTDNGEKMLVDDENDSVIGIDVDACKEAIVRDYNVREESLDGCSSLFDIADAMNFYYGFKKFVVKYWSDVSIDKDPKVMIDFCRKIRPSVFKR